MLGNCEVSAPTMDCWGVFFVFVFVFAMEGRRRRTAPVFTVEFVWFMVMVMRRVSEPGGG